MPREAIDAILDAGIMRALVPTAYGGHEMSLLTAVKLYEEFSRIDSAAGWITSNSGGISTFGMMFSAQANRELYADPRAMFAGGWFPPGRAEVVPGGYRVTGQWAFGSGCDYANWLTGQVLVWHNGAPQIGSDGKPVALIIFFPAKAATIIDTWHTLGMRGTGSNDVRIEDLFVPERHCWSVAPIKPIDPAFFGSLYRLAFWTVGPIVASVALGIARAALDDFVSLAAIKTPSYTQTSLADRPIVQERVARARAMIDAGRRNLYSTIRDAEEFVGTAARINIEHGIPLALAGAHAIESACEAVDLVHRSAGTSAIKEEQPFQRYFRDVHTVSQHAFASAARLESLGKLLLGRESDWAFYYL